MPCLLQTNSSLRRGPPRASAPAPTRSLARNAVQPVIGNQVLLRRLPAPPVLQAKLEIGAADDPLEHEADRVAEQVMRMPGPAPAVTPASAQLSRKCAACAEEEKQTLQAKPEAALASTGRAAPSIVHRVLGAPGERLGAADRAFFEPRFGQDFGTVRVHADAEAASSAHAVGALGYTVGEHIVLGAASGGRKLLAHELAHVVQQRAGAGVLRRQTDDDAVDNQPTPAQLTPQAGPAPQTDATQAGTTQPEPAASDGTYPELDALSAKADQLKEQVASVARDQGLPAPPQGRTETGGATVCDPDTGKPTWAIDKSVVPKCMWPCAEKHEQTHADFMAMACEEVGLAFGRIYFWLKVAKQYADQKKPDEVKRALDQADAALQEATKTVAWYTNYMNQTCRYDEGAAYEAGIEVCNTDEIRKRCAATGETDQYNTQMAAWRGFMQNPPNCAAAAKP